MVHRNHWYATDAPSGRSASSVYAPDHTRLTSGMSRYVPRIIVLFRGLEPSSVASLSWHGGSRIAWPICRRKRAASPTHIAVVSSENASTEQTRNRLERRIG